MKPPRIYLDYGATAPIRASAKQAALNAMEIGGNASSIHQEGRKARGLIETAREHVAKLINASPQEIIFTSGGTESNNQVLTSDLGALGKQQPHAAMLMSAIEHSSLIKAQSLSKRPIELIEVDENGVINLNHLETLLKSWQKKSDLPVLVSVMLANNETGVIQPLDKIANLVRNYKGYTHVDAVQALGKITLDFSTMNIDLMSVSGHKIGGMLGAGALVVRQGILISPHIKGGGQELGLRAGTENVPAIAAFGAAAEDVLLELDNKNKYSEMQKKLEAMIQEISSDAIIFGQAANRVPNTTCFAIKNIFADRALMNLDLANISVSSGSACSSGKISYSHVLKAMGVDDELALCALRISFGWNTKPNDLEIFIKEYKKIHHRMMENNNGSN